MFKLKHVPLIFVTLGILAACVVIKESGTEYHTLDMTSEIYTEEEVWRDEWEPLINALIMVESKGNPSVVGKHGDTGILQITPSLVAEVNRLLELQGSDIRYIHKDAFDTNRSIEMFYVIAEHYGGNHDFERMAKVWNRGPQYDKRGQKVQREAETYWRKVQRELRKQNNKNINI